MRLIINRKRGDSRKSSSSEAIIASLILYLTQLPSHNDDGRENEDSSLENSMRLTVLLLADGHLLFIDNKTHPHYNLTEGD